MPINVGELKKLLKGLPNDMNVVIGVDEEISDICLANARIIEVEFTDIVDAGSEIVAMMLLPICICGIEEELEENFGEINSQPELN